MGRLPCQVGGGIRDLESARRVLDAGANRIIIGSSLLLNGQINTLHARALSDAFGTEALVFALDSRGGKVAINGWKTDTSLTAFDMIRTLEPFCDAFLYTHIDTEGLMRGIPMDTIQAIRDATSRRLIAAGGITTRHEIDTLDTMGIDAVVGMALYAGRIMV